MRRAFCAAVDKCRKEAGDKENIGCKVTGKSSWLGPAVAERGQWGGLGTHLLSSLRSPAGGGRKKEGTWCRAGEDTNRTLASSPSRSPSTHLET